MHKLNLEEFCSFYAYPASILFTLSMSQGALPSHTLTFISVCKYMYCIHITVGCMSVFESPPSHSARMDQEQTYNIRSPDLREDALDDILHRIHLQSDDPDVLEHDAERDQL